MKTRIILSLLVIFSCFSFVQSSFAQVTKGWERTVNWSGYLSEPHGLEIDSMGNSWLLVSNDLGFDVFHYDSAGTVLWVSGPPVAISSVQVQALQLDRFNNCVVSSDISDSIQSYINIFKYDPGGNQLWRYNFSQPGYGGTIAIDHADYICVAGTARDSVSQKLHIARIDPGGGLLWQLNYSFPTTSFLYVNGIKILNDSDNNMYVCGIFTDFSDSSKVALLKLTPSGNIIWDRIINYIPAVYGSGVDLSAAFPQSLLLSFASYDQPNSSEFTTVIHFDTAGNQLRSVIFPFSILKTHELPGEDYIFSASIGGSIAIQHIDSTDNVLWLQSYGIGNPKDFLVDQNGSIYVAGSDSDKYVLLKYSSNGNLQWAEHYDDNGLAIFGGFANNLRKDGAGNIYVTGMIYHNIQQFSSHVTTLKYRESPTSVENYSLESMNMIAYPDPASDQVTLKFRSRAIEDYIFSFVDMTGRSLVYRKGKTQQGINELILDVNKFDRGIYFLHLRMEKSNQMIKLILQ